MLCLDLVLRVRKALSIKESKNCIGKDITLLVMLRGVRVLWKTLGCQVSEVSPHYFDEPLLLIGQMERGDVTGHNWPKVRGDV